MHSTLTGIPAKCWLEFSILEKTKNYSNQRFTKGLAFSWICESRLMLLCIGSRWKQATMSKQEDVCKCPQCNCSHYSRHLSQGWRGRLPPQMELEQRQHPNWIRLLWSTRRVSWDGGRHGLDGVDGASPRPDSVSRELRARKRRPFDGNLNRLWESKWARVQLKGFDRS